MRKLLICVAIVLATQSVNGQTSPGVPNPTTTGQWGPSNTKTKTSSTGGYTWIQLISTTTETSTQTGNYCGGVGPEACGGSFSITAGTGVTLFGVTVSVSQGWTSPVQDPCELCRLFLCVNATRTRRVVSGSRTTIQIPGGQSRVSYFGPDVSYSLSKIGTLTLKVNCNTSQAAKDYCCPGTVSTGEPAGYEYVLSSGELFVSADRFGLGPFQPGPVVDLVDVSTIIEVRLGPPSSETEEEWRYFGNVIDELSLTERLDIAEVILDIDAEDPITGRVFLMVKQADGSGVAVDVGTLADIISLDTLGILNPADINLDGVVTEADLEIVEADMLREFQLGAPGDVDVDGNVTQADLDLVAAAMDGDG